MGGCGVQMMCKKWDRLSSFTQKQNLREEGAGEMDVIATAEGREVIVMCICGEK